MMSSVPMWCCELFAALWMNTIPSVFLSVVHVFVDNALARVRIRRHVVQVAQRTCIFIFAMVVDVGQKYLVDGVAAGMSGNIRAIIELNSARPFFGARQSMRISLSPKRSVRVDIDVHDASQASISSVLPF